MNRSKFKDEVFLTMAKNLSVLATCARRQVGCLFVDKKNRIIAAGYNGTAAGAVNCTDVKCAGADCPSGTGLELCEALHAEQNALIQCKFPDEIHTVYCTSSPCLHCIKMLANTGAQRIVFLSEYPHPEAKMYWKALGREWQHLTLGE